VRGAGGLFPRGLCGGKDPLPLFIELLRQGPEVHGHRSLLEQAAIVRYCSDREVTFRKYGKAFLDLIQDIKKRPLIKI